MINLPAILRADNAFTPFQGLAVARLESNRSVQLAKQFDVFLREGQWKRWGNIRRTLTCSNSIFDNLDFYGPPVC